MSRYFRVTPGVIDACRVGLWQNIPELGAEDAEVIAYQSWEADRIVRALAAPGRIHRKVPRTGPSRRWRSFASRRRSI